MLVKPITYKNFEGEVVTENYYFNLTRAEVTKLQLGTVGGYTNKIAKLVGKKNLESIAENPTAIPDNINNDNIPEILEMFEKIILSSVGKRITVDGRSVFVKDEKFTEVFKYSEAYSSIFMELSTNSAAAKAFIEAVFPEPEKTVPEVAK